MGIIGQAQASSLIEKYKCIHPFDHALLDGDGYVLTVRDETTLRYLEHKNIISHEVVFVPPSYVAHLTARSTYGRIGLALLNAAKVHSGLIGRLALELVNLSNEQEPVTIRRGDPFIRLEFLTRDGKPCPYKGQYIFQYMTDDEVSLFLGILSEQYQACLIKPTWNAWRSKDFAVEPSGPRLDFVEA
jgi:dCTP deaminase